MLSVLPLSSLRKEGCSKTQGTSLGATKPKGKNIQNMQGLANINPIPTLYQMMEYLQLTREMRFQLEDYQHMQQTSHYKMVAANPKVAKFKTQND